MWFHPRPKMIEILFALLLVMMSSLALGVKVSQSQLPSLIQIKESLDSNKSILETWDESNECENWLGLTCDDNGLVTSLVLVSYNSYFSTALFYDKITPANQTLENDYLIGNLSSAIVNLTSLNQLAISGNQIGGNIPDQISNLINLTYLDLSSNSLTGTIPESVYSLTNLQLLALSYNGLKGAISDKIGNLTKLQIVDLSQNYLTGSLPDSLQNLSDVYTFSFGVNDLDPSPLPSWLGALNKIIWLDLHGCRFNGSIPDLNDLKDLDYVDLSFNDLSGGLEDQFLNCTKLTALTLASNNLTGAIPSKLNKLPFGFFDLSMNKLNGSIPSSVYDDLSYDIQLLDLTDNKLTGPISSNISKLSFVYGLSFAENFLSGPIPKELGMLPNVYDVVLYSNKLSGMIPDEIANNNATTNLYLYLNNLVGSIPISISNLTDLVTLLVYNNTLTGQLPPELGLLPSLEVFDASSNVLTGSIPETFGQLTSLTSLRLFQNSLSGPIPDLSNLSKLIELDLSYNQLSGQLPNNFPQSLIKLNLRSNRLSGSVPSNFISRLRKLQTLDLSINLFSEPPSFNNTPKSLTFISLSSNLINGLPESAAKTDNSTIQIFGNQPGIENSSYTSLFKNFVSPAVCKNEKRCQGQQDLNPYLFSQDNISCYCSPPIIFELYLFAPLFYNFTSVEEKYVESYIASVGGIDALQVRIINASISTANIVTFTIFVQIFTRNTSPWPNKDSIFIIDQIFKSQASYDSFRKAGPYKVINFIKDTSGSNDGTSNLDNKEGSKVATWIVILLSLIFGTILILTILLAFILARFYINKGNTVRELEGKVIQGMARPVKLSEIQQATKYFNEELLLGAGGFGSVYKGFSKEGKIWAVKRAKKVSLQSKTEFENEVISISRMDHQNLVKLLGYCDESNEQILIYEFMPRGTLRNALDPKRAGVIRPALTFEERLFIALGSASGLNYLHSGATQTIIHRDIKSENILLDNGTQAKVADFGLLKKNIEDLENDEENHSNTKLAGTPGYMDPEYYTTYKVTTKSDVYSFGVVLLELITGKAPIMEDKTTVRSRHDQDAVSMITVAKWAIPHIEMGKIQDIIDPLLENNYDTQCAEALAQLASACLQRKGANRPDMAIVHSRLREIYEAVKTGQSLSQSRVFVTQVDNESSIIEPPLPSINEAGVTGYFAPSEISYGR